MLIIDTTEYSEEINASLSADKQVQSNYLHDYLSNACYLTMLLVQVIMKISPSEIDPLKLILI